jgi:hypothetical protein
MTYSELFTDIDNESDIIISLLYKVKDCEQSAIYAEKLMKQNVTQNGIKAAIADAVTQAINVSRLATKLAGEIRIMSNDAIEDAGINADARIIAAQLAELSRETTTHAIKAADSANRSNSTLSSLQDTLNAVHDVVTEINLLCNTAKKTINKSQEILDIINKGSQEKPIEDANYEEVNYEEVNYEVSGDSYYDQHVHVEPVQVQPVEPVEPVENKLYKTRINLRDMMYSILLLYAIIWFVLSLSSSKNKSLLVNIWSSILTIITLIAIVLILLSYLKIPVIVKNTPSKIGNTIYKIGNTIYKMYYSKTEVNSKTDVNYETDEANYETDEANYETDEANYETDEANYETDEAANSKTNIYQMSEF